jgi:hypothetical protein
MSPNSFASWIGSQGRYAWLPDRVRAEHGGRQWGAPMRLILISTRPARPAMKLNGIVTDARTHKPIAGARIRVG